MTEITKNQQVSEKTLEEIKTQLVKTVGALESSVACQKKTLELFEKIISITMGEQGAGRRPKNFPTLRLVKKQVDD